MLAFKDTRERPQSATGTTNDVCNSDESIIDMVEEEDMTITRRRAEEELVLDNGIRLSTPTGRRASGTEGKRSGKSFDRQLTRILEVDEVGGLMDKGTKGSIKDRGVAPSNS